MFLINGIFCYYVESWEISREKAKEAEEAEKPPKANKISAMF